MKGIMHHSPTDEDISNVLKEFTVDFLLKGYGILVKQLHAQLLDNFVSYPLGKIKEIKRKILRFLYSFFTGYSNRYVPLLLAGHLLSQIRGTT